MSDDDIDKKMQDACCKAEQEALQHFVTHVPVPSRVQCEEAIKWNEQGTSVEILAEFGERQYAAFEQMWKNAFNESVVQSFSGIGDKQCKVMFGYAVNRIFRKLVYENNQYAKNKRIRYNGHTEIIDTPSILCSTNKIYIWPVWGIMH